MVLSLFKVIRLDVKRLRREFRIIEYLANLLSGSKLVRPVCKARTKKRTAETEATEKKKNAI
jgi:hypothetical protein